MGKDALIACSKAIDGVGDNTCLVEMLENHYQNRLWYAMDEIYRAGIKGVASLSKFVIDGYLKDDSVCKEIVDKRIELLANIIKQKTGEVSTDVYLCGGIFENNICVVEKLKSFLSSYNVQITNQKTIYGAVSLAKKECKDFNYNDFYINFERDYKELSR